MARFVHCSGCGRREQEPVATITKVTVTVTSDMPARSWETDESHSEDLCDACVRSLLATFMGVKPRGFVSDPPILREVV